MGSKAWLVASAVTALSSLIVGCNSGPQRDTHVLGASNGRPPLNANGQTAAFPVTGQQKNALPQMGPLPGANSIGNPNNAFAPTSNSNLPLNSGFQPHNQNATPHPFNPPAPQFPNTGGSLPQGNSLVPAQNNIRPLSSGSTPAPTTNFANDRTPGAPLPPIDMQR
jgi:hypothetical protein